MSEPMSAADMIMRVFNNIEKEQIEDSNTLFKAWREVVVKVYNYGEKLAAHSKIIDLKNGMLLIETDHSGWIQIFQMYSEFILKGLRMKAPQLQIKSLAFRLEGSNAVLHEVDYETELCKGQREMIAEIDKRQRDFGISMPKSFENAGKNLPPELRERFERMKKNMLTNIKK